MSDTKSDPLRRYPTTTDAGTRDYEVVSQGADFIPGYRITFGELERACAFLKANGWGGLLSFDEAVKSLRQQGAERK